MKIENEKILKKYISMVINNAWNGTENRIIKIVSDIGTITICGYVIEPCYELFEPTASISLNDKNLYSRHSCNIENYRNMEYESGIFSSFDDVIKYLLFKLKGKECKIIYE